MIWAGLLMMILGSISALMTRGFLKKIHRMGVSDVAGAVLVLIGMMSEGFEPLKAILSILSVLIWVPLSSHVISKAFVSRVGR